MGTLAVVLAVVAFLLCLALAFYIGQHMGRVIEGEEVARLAEEQCEILAYNGQDQCSRALYDFAGLVRMRRRQKDQRAMVGLR